jgi:hypothetical protein
MKPSFKLALFAFSALSVAPSLLAQSYSGTVGDLNTVFDPPMNINGTLCDVHVNTGNEHAYKACSDGVSASRWMAEKYAKNTGKYLGCLDGFYQGMSDGYSAGANPTADMTAQAAAYVKGATFESANTRGLSKAQAEGQTESADQIIARYRSVVNLRDAQNRQVLPNKDYNYPQVTFNGFSDGYEFDILKQIGSEFDAVYATGWVNKDSKFEDRLAARRALALQKEYAANLCNQTDTIFGRRGMPAVSIWDFFRANRQVNFQNYGWRNPDWAWEIFDRDERTLEQYQTFARLKTLEKTVTESINITKEVLKTDAAGNPVRKLDAAGVPAVDAAGKPIFEYETVITGSRIETKRVKLSDSEVQALANIYIGNFKTAYDRFYARQYASINYHTEGLDKYKVAKIIGNSMGQEVANYIARREAYNSKYQLESAKKYAAEVKRLYKDSFDHLIGIFENNAVVELNEAEIVGQIQDAIFRPGEELKVQFAATNLGEKAAASSINFESTADVQASTQGFSFTAPVLTRSNFVTNVLGRTSERLEARSAINVSMAIKNPGDLEEVARALVVRKQKNLTLNDYTEVDGVNGTLDFLAGSLSLVVNVKNPAKNVESPISIVEASIGNLGFIQKNVEPIGPGAVRQVVMNLENMDPLAVILAGTVSGNVNVRLGNKIAHHQAISYAIGTDRSNAVVLYHDSLATKRNNNTGREGKADRMAKLDGMLEELVKGDIERNVLWKKGEEVNGTIIALVQRTYDDSKRAGRIDNEAQKAYDDLGTVFARNVKNVRSGGGIRLAKPNKENYLKEIGKFAKISTKLKDWDK